MQTLWLWHLSNLTLFYYLLTMSWDFLFSRVKERWSPNNSAARRWQIQKTPWLKLSLFTWFRIKINVYLYCSEFHNIHSRAKTLTVVAMPFLKKVQILDPKSQNVTENQPVLTKASMMKCEEASDQKISFETPSTPPASTKFSCKLCGLMFSSFEDLEKHSTSPVNRWFSRIRGRKPSFGL